MNALKKIIIFLHRWLGILSGAVVFFICLTGALLVFEKEIKTVTEQFQFVQISPSPVLTPATIVNIVQKETGKKVSNISYPGPQKSVICTLKTGKRRSKSELVYVNPYTGQVLKVKELEKDFFKWLVNGHYYLWLPSKPGKTVVASSTAIFLVLLISGMIIWFPGKRSKIKQSFRIKWQASPKRLLYDLHNVLGFYSMLLLAILAISGLIFGFKWVDTTFYRISSGGRSIEETQKPKSNISASGKMLLNADTLFFLYMKDKIRKGSRQTLYFPEKKQDVFMLYDNPEDGTRYRRETRYFDRYSLKELFGKGSGFYAGKFDVSPFSDKLKRMNYDIHVGAIYGWPTKILAFLSSMTGVILVITGYIMWIGNTFRKTKKKRNIGNSIHIKQKYSMKKLIYLVPILFIALAVGAQIKEKSPRTGNVHVQFQNQVQGNPLKLKDVKYKNRNGDDFTVSEFKYYISNISFVAKNGEKINIPESYYLLDQEKPGSLRLDISKVPAGEYKGLAFIIGVDSLRNLKGDQSGALDPANKMYWSWKTGYIFLKMTGESPQSPNGRIHFDIGGIKPETNTIRKQDLLFPKMLKVNTGKVSSVGIVTDLAQLFEGKETIDFSEINKCMGGAKAVKIADNYVNGLFKVSRIQSP